MYQVIRGYTRRNKNLLTIGNVNSPLSGHDRSRGKKLTKNMI